MSTDNKLYTVVIPRIDFWELKRQKAILAKMQGKIDGDPNFKMAECEAVDGILNLLDHITDGIEDNEGLEGWKCTHIDTAQYGRQISETVFEFRQYDQDNDSWINQEVDLDDYSDEEKIEAVLAYGYSIARLNEENDNPSWIIAECIFECEN